jgi:hypothetical protein
MEVRFSNKTDRDIMFISISKEITDVYNIIGSSLKFCGVSFLD